jgi:regulator of RNase E activity RraA
MTDGGSHAPPVAEGVVRPPDPELPDDVSTRLFSSVLGDVMDALGLQRQFLPPRIRPLSEDMVVFGRAMPVLEADIEPEEAGNSGDGRLDKPFGLMFEALDSLQRGEVYVATGASPSYALWGGLMSNRAIVVGAAGAVLDGYSRDTREIRSLGFPTFSYGGYGQDQRPRGRVVAYRTTVTIGAATIHPGDFVFGDLDGVCIVPQVAAEEVLRRALEKVDTESLVRRHILDGSSSADAFERFGAM